jgi:hypothetical protein
MKSEKKKVFSAIILYKSDEEGRNQIRNEWKLYECDGMEMNEKK